MFNKFKKQLKIKINSYPVFLMFLRILSTIHLIYFLPITFILVLRNNDHGLLMHECSHAQFDKIQCRRRHSEVLTTKRQVVHENSQAQQLLLNLYKTLVGIWESTQRINSLRLRLWLSFQISI